MSKKIQKKVEVDRPFDFESQNFSNSDVDISGHLKVLFTFLSQLFLQLDTEILVQKHFKVEFSFYFIVYLELEYLEFYLRGSKLSLNT